MNWSLLLVSLAFCGTTFAYPVYPCGARLLTYPKLPGANKSQCVYFGGYNLTKTYGYIPQFHFPGNVGTCYSPFQNLFGPGKNGSLAFRPDCNTLALYSSPNCSGTPVTVPAMQCVTLDNIAFFLGPKDSSGPLVCGAYLLPVQDDTCPTNYKNGFHLHAVARDTCIQGGPVDVLFHDAKNTSSDDQCDTLTLWPKGSKCVGKGSIPLSGIGAAANNCRGGWLLRATDHTDYDSVGSHIFPCGCPNEAPSPAPPVPPSPSPPPPPPPSGASKNYPAFVLLAIVVAFSLVADPEI
eukprot:TRINITY_DN66313_c12_g1_i1.p1 TRINITY_DN66313_c12_g1~~TRINITY_DN66313_c12_g1_i1.p1  ORF type:complete len:294 (-),score=31.69 TRINITY_DN66313_c12_g1_i1:96-977(-)